MSNNKENIKSLTKLELTILINKLQKEIEDLKWEITYIKTNINNINKNDNR